MAALLAQNRSDIAGVIGCGAGFQPRPGQAWPYYGLVGTEDFNLIEFQQLDQALAPFQVAHHIETFAGGHAWPEAGEVDAALDWLELRAMAAGSLERDSARIAKAAQSLEQPIHGASDYLQLRSAVSLLQGLVDVGPARQRLAGFQKGREYARYRSDLQAAQQKEISLREAYQFRLLTEGEAYWAAEVKQLRQIQRLVGQQAMNLRVLNYLSLLAYGQTTQALAQGDNATAAQFARKYALIDPENSETQVLLAQVYSRQGNPGEALHALHAAVSLGFADRDRLLSEPDFASLAARPEWPALLDRLPSPTNETP